MNSFERRLLKRFDELEDLKSITPGVQVDVHLKGKRIGRIDVGNTYPYYDLASLTKILFTSSVGIHYFSQNKRALDMAISGELPWWHRKTTPRGLLTHTAGLEWWIPMYKKLKGPMNHSLRWEQMKKNLAKVKPQRRTKAVYSDIDLWMIGAYLESATGRSLLEMWEDNAERMKIRNIFFHPDNKPKYARAKYAPTEECGWRGKILRGEVHDENTWALGGIAPHSGLFGTIEAVSAWGLELRKTLMGDSDRMGTKEMARYFTGRRTPRKVGDWGLGFMKPSKGRASCGKYFNPHSYGHTGFTGTSYWCDPMRDLQVVILSNRVHPTRTNQAFVQLRPQIHNWVCESLR
jgi:CubicO group peptidase (beta-lactamase class C family)